MKSLVLEGSQGHCRGQLRDSQTEVGQTLQQVGWGLNHGRAGPVDGAGRIRRGRRPSSGPGYTTDSHTRKCQKAEGRCGCFIMAILGSSGSILLQCKYLICYPQVEENLCKSLPSLGYSQAFDGCRERALLSKRGQFKGLDVEKIREKKQARKPFLSGFYF